MYEVLPLFKSHYSIGRSILTLSDAGSSDSTGPDSIIDICLDNKLKTFYLIEDGMTGFLEGYYNSTSNNLDMRFGLRVTLCRDMNDKDKDKLKDESKCIIFCKNKTGYELLLKIYTDASTNGFYYIPRIDFETLHKYWDDSSLSLVIPFYDSFIHRNKFDLGNFVPDFSQIFPTFFIENNDLPFDEALKRDVESYCGDKHDVQKTKSIYYKNKSDFPHYMTFRCISDSNPGRAKKTLTKPNFDHMCSDNFSFESWKEVVNG
jgi:DNA polymerase III alpha subunit